MAAEIQSEEARYSPEKLKQVVAGLEQVIGILAVLDRANGH